MTTTTTNVPEEQRWELRVDGDLAVVAEYRLDDDRITFTHTRTEPDHRGEGLARQLVDAALADARDRGLAVVPECPYVRKVVGEDADLVALVPADDRDRLGL
ncbi:GNAT family N-acetyltransferase [Iamia majanohamensis]|uniref:GNAT family N-acetyltransferase n=1 Tax=Iamia majanohamensis TaxID=467976 RepID=A0AAE9Y5U8_9ACTN|nr:GNAT family N-acetyltransferase [Iamia majanohamensis]WCO66061.1 GNAT family N-acetyltransferase [Iamia majanohamensis]